jgi:hypothetical protein
MKLLDKKKINSDQNFQKALLIQDGIKIAKKIDILRETLSTLENQHSSFIDNTKKALKEATEELNGTKAQLESDIKTLQSQREALRIPLDNEWAKLNEDRIEFNHSKDELVKEKLVLIERETEIKKKEEELIKRESALRNMEEELDADVDAVQLALRNAQAEEKQSKQRSEFSDKLIEKRIAEVVLREKKCLFDEEANEIVAQTLKEKEKQIENREKAVRDKYETLLRNEKRNERINTKRE